MPETLSDAKKIEETLRASKRPLTIDEICRLIGKRVGERERNLVRVNLHRLGERGLIRKTEAKYSLKTPE